MFGAFLLTCFICLHFQFVESILIDRSDRNYKNIQDADKNTGDFVEMWGYPTEEHDIVTDDGFILTIFRIPHGSKNREKINRIPILLEHGVYLNSDQWVLRGTTDLVFLLSEMGYDVWMGNQRGTRYSRHSDYTIEDFEFWNYSPDDIANNDIPLAIDYVLNKTGKASLSYVGHSRGCTTAVMLLSSQPEYNTKVHLLQLMAPVVYTTYIDCPFFHLAGREGTTLMRIATLENMLNSLEISNLFGQTTSLISLEQSFCGLGSAYYKLCPMLYFMINGGDFDNFNQSLVPTLVEHFAEGIAVKEIIQYLQIAEDNRFQKFDYYDEENIKLYGSAIPPEYKISNVISPAYIYFGPNDLLISVEDNKKFMAQLPNLLDFYTVPYDMFNHIDYFWGMDTNRILFPKFLYDITTFHNTHNFTNSQPVKP